MDDLISRQAAIDALRKKQDNGKGDISRFYNTIIQHDIEAIMALPSSLSTNLAEVGTDCISRQAALDALNNIEIPRNASWYQYYQQALTAVDKLPPAQPERIKGRWISADAIFGGEPFYCSECGENTRDTVMGKPRWKFCPMCGSRNEVTE